MATHNNPKTQSIIDALSANEALSATLLEAFQQQVEATGDGSFARFTQALTELSRDIVKPAAKAHRAANPQTRGSSTDNAWRSEQKALFSGRGNQWIKLPVDSITETLDRLDSNGHDVTNYMTWINNAGFAWVRYAGPRLNDGNQAAAFEVRINGSKVDQPDCLHYMDNDMAMAITQDDRLLNTPHALRLEIDDAVVAVQVDNDVEEDVDTEA